MVTITRTPKLKKKKTPEELEEERLRKEKEKKGQVFRTEEGRPSGVELPSGRTFLGLSPADVEKIQRKEGIVEETPEEKAKREAEEERKIEFEKLETEPLREELIQKATPGQEPSLKPELTTAEAAGSLFLEFQTQAGNIIGKSLFGEKFKEQKSTDLIKTDFGKALAGATAAVGGTLALVGGFAGAKFLIAGAAKASLGSKVAGFSATLLGLGGSILGFGKILDLNRGEIDEMVAVAQGMTIAGERAQALAINSPQDIPFVMLQLQQMSDDLNYAESVIQQKSIRNFRYRGSQEHFNDMIAFRNARLAILRRLEAVENIAITGAAPGSLDDFILSQMGGEEIK